MLVIDEKISVGVTEDAVNDLGFVIVKAEGEWSSVKVLFVNAKLVTVINEVV